MNIKKKYNIEELLFRRQFILGPYFMDAFPSWSKIKISDLFCLTVHPELNVSQTVQGDKSITLLGFILDPDNEQARDKDILNDLMQKLNAHESLDSFFQYTYPLGGRWILIVDNGKRTALFHDPMGLRQVFFTNRHFEKELWCASQPGIMAEVLNLEMGKNAVNEFIASDVYKTWNECFWPGDSTPYEAVTHLLPNHYLDLNTRVCHRYWPDSVLKKLSVRDAVEINSKMLKALIRSAANRFDLAFTITAGWDSRLLLAASRELSQGCYYFSIFRRDRKPDIMIPARLLPKLGLKHHVIEYPAYMDEEFRRIYTRNVSEAHDFWGKMAQGLYSNYPQDRVCVKGNASEIARVRFRIAEGEKVTARTLSKYSTLTFPHQKEMEKNPFVNRAWEEWLLNLNDLHNVHILDLFYWEHWAGNFAAMTQAEFDIVQEVFTPYNCRNFLTNMLSVNEKYRDHDEPILYKKLILKLWPEVLSEPVNPQEKRRKKQKIRPMIKKLLVNMHVYEPLKNALSRYR